MTEPANLIIFLTDNHAAAVTGCYGHPIVQTPNIDRIAADGVRFTDAYCVSPLCCPSRAAIATGRYPHETGFWDNSLAYDGSVATWQQRVRDQGHLATAIGKLHYKSGDVDNGFSEEIVPLHILDGKGAVIALLRATPEGMPPRKGHKEIYEKSGVGEADYQIYDRQITDRAVEWLEAHATDQGKPWVLLVSYASPHPPFTVPERFWNKYPLDRVPMPVQWRKADQPQHPATQYLSWMNSFAEEFEEDFVRRVIAGYCGLISVVDEHVGTVMAAAERLGLMDKTRVLYTSDHGEAAGHHGIMGKGNHYEHALNVPLLISGPGVPEGRVCEQITSHVDLFPTIVEALGADLGPEDASLPGISLWPAITGEREESRHSFAEFHALGALNVPLLISGPGVPEGRVCEQITSHVDLFPTIVEALGAHPEPEDATLPGISLWPAITGEREEPRHAFAEFHAMGALNAGFSYREGDYKLIYHVGMPRQLFDVEHDPLEEQDLMACEGSAALADTLEVKLRQIVDPEAVEERAKADQRAHIDALGGIDAVRGAGVFSASPIPGKAAVIEKTG